MKRRILSLLLCMATLFTLCLSQGLYVGAEGEPPVEYMTELEPNLAVLTANAGCTVAKFDKVVPLFTDRNNYQTLGEHPSYLNGKSYLYGSMNGSSGTVAAAGYVYVLLPTTTYPALIADALSKGYVKQNTPEFNVGIYEKLAIYEKYVEVGTVVSFAKWNIVIFAGQTTTPYALYEEGRLAAITPANGSNAVPFTEHARLFDNRLNNYTTGNMFPSYFNGKSFLLDSLDTGSWGTVTRAGGVYVLAPSTGFAATLTELTNAGYVKKDISTFPMSGVAERLNIYYKNLQVGDTVHFSKWNVVVFDGMTDQEYYPVEFEEDMAVLAPQNGSKALKMEGKTRIFDDRNYHTFNEIPSALEGMSFLHDGIESGAWGTVTTAGYVYLLVPNMNYASLVTGIEGAGYTKDSNLLFTLNHAMESGFLYKKYVQAGDTVHFGKWVLILFNTIPDGEYHVPASISTAPTVITNPGPEYDISTRLWQGCPTLDKTAGGTVWAGWFTGGEHEPDLGNYGVIARSTDDGASWTDPYMVLVHPDPYIRVEDPQLWVDPLGRLWVFWSQNEGADFDGKMANWGMYTENPDDPVPTWSDPVWICDGLMRNKPTVLSTGEWLMVCYDLTEMDQTPVYISRDEGETWPLYSKAFITSTFFDEHMILERNDGSLWMLLRTTDSSGISQCFSYDRGQSWTNASKDANLTGPGSRFFLRRLQSGNVLLVNHYNYAGRSHMTAMLSMDDGKTWPYTLVLDARSDVSYPDGMQDENGAIYIIHDRGRYAAKEMLLSVFTEADIIAGDFVGATSRSRVLISTATIPPYTFKGNFDNNKSYPIVTGSPISTGTVEVTNNALRVFGRTDSADAYAITTGITGKNVTNFKWEFDYIPTRTAWNIDKFLFCSDGNEGRGYIIRVQGTGAAGGQKMTLYKNDNMSNILGESAITYVSGGAYRVSVEAKGNRIEIYFYPKGGNKPVIPQISCTDSEFITGGEFVYTSWAGEYAIDNIYVGGSALEDLNYMAEFTGNQVTPNITTGQANTGAVEVTNESLRINGRVDNADKYAVSSLITGRNVYDFEAEFEYTSTLTGWNTDKFLFKTQGTESNGYIFRIEGNSHATPRRLTLYKNNNPAAPLATMNLSEFSSGKTYRIRVEMKGGRILCYFYPANEDRPAQPIFDVVDTDPILFGDFCFISYAGDYRIDTMSIQGTYASTEPDTEEPMESQSLTFNGAAGYLSGLSAHMTVESLLAGLAEYDGEIRLLKGSSVITEGLVGTGVKLQRLRRAAVLEEYTLILYGDVNGDSAIDLLDLVDIKKHLVEASRLPYAEAADVNHENGLNPSDLTLLKQYILDIGTITQ